MKFFEKIVLNGLDIFCKDSTARSGVQQNAGNITQLRTDVDSYSDEIEAISDATINRYENVLFISDSYGTDSYATPTWITLVKNKLGLSSSNFHNFSRGSTSFGYNGGLPSDQNNGLNFCDVLNKAVSTMSQEERNKVKCIVIGGGANDYVANSETSIAVGINTFIQTARTNFPNAVIECYIMGWTNQAARANYLVNYGVYLNEFRKNGCKCFKVFSVIVPRSKRGEDGVHPTSAGHEALADSVYGVMMGGAPLYPSQVFVSSFAAIKANFIDEENVLVRIAILDKVTDNTVTLSQTKAALTAFTNEIIEGNESSSFAFTAPTTVVTSGPTAAYNIGLTFGFAIMSGSLNLVGIYNGRKDDGTRDTIANVVQYSTPAIAMTVPIYLL